MCIQSTQSIYSIGMAAPVNMEHIISILECKICLEKYENPKMLTCSHHFCKKCIENIMLFNTDGSATITCPLRCSSQTVLSNKQTVNDLTVSYDFTNILDAFKSEEAAGSSPHVPLCNYSKNCTKVISIYCCNLYMCDRCYLKHKDIQGQHDGVVNLVYNDREKFQVLCEVHDSPCTHICSDDKFLCQYCLCRDKMHEKHSKNTIANDVALLKQALLNDLKKKEKVYEFHRATEKDIMLNTKEFDNILNVRKEECLSQYTKFLNEREDVLRQEFKRMCDEHIGQYVCIGPGYYQDKLQKEDIKLAVQKRKILNTLLTSENKSMLNCSNISLIDTYNFRSDDPLGLLQVTVTEDVSINDNSVSTLTTNLKTQINKRNLTPVREIKTRVQHGSDHRKLDSNLRSHENKQNKDVYNMGSMKKELSSKSVQPFFDIAINSKYVGRIVFNMFEDVTPLTCCNFVGLCTHKRGYGYKGSKFYRVWPGSYCSGGDIFNSSGSSGKSYYGEKFKPENFTKKHDKYGILTMGSSGGLQDSRFGITFDAQPDWDGCLVVFGEVAQETQCVLKKIEAVGGGRPPPMDIVIVNCGVL